MHYMVTAKAVGAAAAVVEQQQQQQRIKAFQTAVEHARPRR